MLTSLLVTATNTNTPTPDGIPGITGTLLLEMGFVMLVAGYGIGRGIEWAIRQALTAGKPLVLQIDRETMLGRWVRPKVKNGEWMEQDGAVKHRRALLQEFAIPTNKGRVWLMDRSNGWNLRPLTAKEIHAANYGAHVTETVTDPNTGATVLKDALGLGNKLDGLFSSVVYGDKTGHNLSRQTMKSMETDDKWGWVMPVALCCLGALVAILGLVIWLVIHFKSGGNAGNAPPVAIVGGGR